MSFLKYKDHNTDRIPTEQIKNSNDAFCINDLFIHFLFVNQSILEFLTYIQRF